MPFCENCGTKLSDTAKFCPNCGQKVGGAAFIAGPDNQVVPASNDPNKEELISCLAAYAEGLFTFREALRRLFPFCPLRERILVGFEGESFVLRAEQDDTKKTLYSAPLFDWATLHLHREEVMNQRVSRLNLVVLEKMGCSIDTPLLRCPAFGKIWPENLPEVLLRMWRLRCGQMDFGSIKTIQEELKKVFAFLGDFSELRYLRIPNPLESKDLDVIRALSLLNPQSFADELRKKAREFVRTLWEFRRDVLIGNVEKVKSSTWFLPEKHINLNTNASLCSALDRILAFFPGRNELASEYLPAACDAIEEMAKNLDESFRKGFFFPPQYRSPECAVGLARLLLDGKADTWKEAMVLFDTEKYREAVLQGLGDISGQIALLNQQVKSQTASILGELKITNAKLSSVAKSTFITAVFGND